MMISLLKFLLIASSLLFAFASEEDAVIRGSKSRNLAVQVKVCYKGKTRLITLKRLKYFLGLGATRGACNKACPADAKLCPDGSYVYRDPSKNCRFKRCPRSGKCCDPNAEPVLGHIPFCEEGSACCPDGTWGCSIGDGKTFNCGGKLITSGFGPKCSCANDTKVCPDGVVLKRDPSHNCDFQSCPKPPQPKCCDPLLEPGADGTKFPCRGEGYACCPDGTWACSIGDGKTFPCGGEQITSGFGEKCPDEVVCTLDVQSCPDGSFVGRDPANNCEFFPCENIRVCPADVKTCPDGSFVSRDPALGCAFTPCPPTDPVACTEEAKLCPDGTAVVRDSNNNCEFPPCPTTVCTMDAKKCPDGSFVSRNPVNGCQFEECPPGSSARALRSIQCTADVKQCPDGSYVGRDPNNKCRFYPCTLVLFCTDDVYRCPDGSYVSRDPLNNCAFPPCPPGGDVRKLAPTKYCTDDVKKCPDGSYVGRDPKTCKFYPCPVVVGSNCTLC